MTFCWPSWYAQYAAFAASPEGKRVVASGCVTSGGNVQCDPKEMAVRAGVSLEIYTLARYMTSEVGSGPIAERIAVGQAANNRARLERLSQGIVSLLLYRVKAASGYGYYGPINVRDASGNVVAGGYGRWAATSKDPTVANILLAQGILDGTFGDFNHGADNQDGYEHFSNPSAAIDKQAAQGDYWVGPIVGVDHWRTFQFRHYGVKASSVIGQALIARAKAAIAGGKSDRPNWAAMNLPTCSPMNRAVAVLLGLGVVGLVGVGYVHARRRGIITF